MQPALGRPAERRLTRPQTSFFFCHTLFTPPSLFVFLFFFFPPWAGGWWSVSLRSGGGSIFCFWSSLLPGRNTPPCRHVLPRFLAFLQRRETTKCTYFLLFSPFFSPENKVVVCFFSLDTPRARSPLFPCDSYFFLYSASIDSPPSRSTKQPPFFSNVRRRPSFGWRSSSFPLWQHAAPFVSRAEESSVTTSSPYFTECPFFSPSMVKQRVFPPSPFPFFSAPAGRLFPFFFFPP